MTKKFEPEDIPEFLSVLERTISRLEQISSRKDEVELTNSIAEGEWTIKQILAHICSCQDVWSYSIYAMLAVDNPQLYPLHPRKMAVAMEYEELSYANLLTHFKMRRDELFRILQKLPHGSWTREATINGRQHSVFSQVRRMAIHERDHWEQIEKVLN
jgi:hypothetical protein